MKKRSMLAIASFAAGCVLAAVTPSHAEGEELERPVDDVHTTVEELTGDDSIARHEIFGPSADTTVHEGEAYLEGLEDLRALDTLEALPAPDAGVWPAL
ncbi:hypothetical protein [Streptomyces sp. NPDC002644]